MTDQSYHVYVIQGRGQRDYSDCQAALAHVPARMTALPFLGTEDEVIAKTRDADALVTSASPVTRSVMSALEGLKVVARTGVGYDVIESIDGTKAQLTEQPFSARPPLPADSRVSPGTERQLDGTLGQYCVFASISPPIAGRRTCRQSTPRCGTPPERRLRRESAPGRRRVRR